MAVDQWLIAAAAGVVFFANLGVTRLWEMDEPLYASCARHMWLSGDWIVPYYNGHVFYEKPPLMFWTMAAGFAVFGQSEFAARFCSAVLGVGTALATYHLGQRLFGRDAGLWAGLIVASTVIFTVSARAATVDSTLTFLTTLAMLLFVIGLGTAPLAEGQNLGANAGAPAGITRGRWLPIALAYVCLGLAVLAKGPVGALLPAAAIGMFLWAIDGFAPAPCCVPRGRCGR